MSVKTKMTGTFVVLAIVAGLGFYINRPHAHTTNGHKKPGNMLVLTVTFANAPRVPPVQVSYRVGTKAIVHDGAESNYQLVVYAESGTEVWIRGDQVQSGALFCRIQMGATDLAWDHNLADGKDFVTCLAVVP